MNGGALVDANGRLGALRGVAGPVISAFGPRGSAKSSLLNDVYYTKFEVATTRSEQKTLGAAVERVYFANSDVAVVDVEGFDSSDESRYKIQSRSSTLSLAVADVVLFNCYMHDLARDVPAALSSLQSAALEVTKMEKDKLIPVCADKTPVLLIARDFDSGTESIDQILAAVKTEIPAEITDRFNVEVMAVRNLHIQRDEFESDVITLRQKSEALVVAAADKLRSKEIVTKVWNKLGQDEKDVPSQKELLATFECNAAFRAAWATVQEGLDRWTAETQAGRLYEDFGQIVSNYTNAALRNLEEEAGASKSSSAFRRKRAELLGDIHRSVNTLFTLQIRKLSEEEYENFRVKMEGIQRGQGQDLKKIINNLVSDTRKSFVERAEAMRPKGTRSRYDADKKELFQNLKEAASSRIQLAQLRNEYKPPKREPVSIWFHFLHPHPFGKDSRSEQLNQSDSVQFDASRYRERREIGTPLPGPRARRESREFEDALEKYFVSAK